MWKSQFTQYNIITRHSVLDSEDDETNVVKQAFVAPDSENARESKFFTCIITLFFMCCLL